MAEHGGQKGLSFVEISDVVLHKTHFVYLDYPRKTVCQYLPYHFKLNYSANGFNVFFLPSTQ